MLSVQMPISTIWSQLQAHMFLSMTDLLSQWLMQSSILTLSVYRIWNVFYGENNKIDFTHVKQVNIHLSLKEDAKGMKKDYNYLVAKKCAVRYTCIFTKKHCHYNGCQQVCLCLKHKCHLSFVCQLHSKSMWLSSLKQTRIHRFSVLKNDSISIFFIF